MRVLINYIQGLWSKTELLIGAVFGFLWTFCVSAIGGIDGQIQALCTLVALDYATGVFAGYKTHTLSSQIAYHGLLKKCLMFAVIGVGVLIDNAMATHTVRTFFVSAYAIIEAMSMAENIDRAGYGDIIPSWLRGALQQVARSKQIPINTGQDNGTGGGNNGGGHP
jgi:toxin secretion/phage lysis holin